MRVTSAETGCPSWLSAIRSVFSTSNCTIPDHWADQLIGLTTDPPTPAEDAAAAVYSFSARHRTRTLSHVTPSTEYACGRPILSMRVILGAHDDPDDAVGALVPAGDLGDEGEEDVRAHVGR